LGEGMSFKRRCRELAERFWAKVKIIDDANSCWEWQAGKKLCGKGQHYRGIFRVEDKCVDAARVAYAIANNLKLHDIELFVLHHCDNGICVRPKHLYEGTQLQNIQDRVDRGRNADIKGMNHPRRKLNEDQIRFIRENYKPRAYGQGYGNRKYLANKFGVHASQINKIISGVSWVGG
jgi:hypothetical protein